MRVQADVEKLRASAAALRLLNDDLAPTLLKLEVGNLVLELVDFFVDSRLINELDALVDAIRTRGRRLTTDGESLATRLTAFAERLEAADGSYLLSLANVTLSDSEKALLPKKMDKERLFNKDHLDEIANTDIPGTNSSELNTAMETLINPKASKAEIAAAIKMIAEKCEISEAEAAANYKELRKRLDEQSPPAEKLNLWLHPDFLGSGPNMIFGKVVGDALGMHPAFAALLSPTGGIAGLGNFGLGKELDGTALGIHGGVHDAAGYLKKHHGIGPGYDYLRQEAPRSAENPLTGQESGIKYWAKEKNGYRPYLQDLVDDSRPLTWKVAGLTVPEKVTEAGEEAITQFIGLHLGGAADIKRGFDEANQAVKDTANYAANEARRAANEAQRVTTEALNKAASAFSF